MIALLLACLLLGVAAAQAKSGFARLSASETGIAFTNFLSIDRYTTNQIYLNGSGVAAGDIDSDGRCDVFFAGLSGQSRLYRNVGNWKFEDTKFRCDLDATGVVLADLDGDRDLDLLVNSVGQGTYLFANDGKGNFTNQTVLNPKKCGASLALADIEGDGDLDIYIANYRIVTMRDEPNAPFRVNSEGGRTVILEYQNRRVTEPDLVGRFAIAERGRIVENGEADVLYRNDGGGRFTALSFTDGTFLDEDGKPLAAPPYDWGLSVMMRDINGDRAPDIYVCNDFASPDRIWLNDGRGKFRALPRHALRHTSMFSMGVDFADIDRDGLDDFFVVDMLARDHVGRHVRIGGVPPYTGIEERPQYAHNTLFRNRGDGTFAELAWFAGVEASDWSWTPIFLDVDLDGYEDLLITTGHERDAMNADVMERAETMKARRKLSDWELLNLNNLFGRLAPPNLAFRNRGDLTFEDASAAWGFDARGVSHGMCLADLDNDHDLDVVMNNLNEAAGVYQNDATAARVAVRLKGQGIGAKITLRGEPLPVQSQEVISGGRYLSGDEALRVFAAASNNMTLEVVWRDGTLTLVSNVAPNRAYELEFGVPPLGGSGAPPPKGGTPNFSDVSQLLNHTHVEEPFDDFARQPLLPWRLSQLGPGVAWHDLDSDGWEDLVIGSGKGGALAVYRNDGRGGFSHGSNSALSKVVSRDQTGIVGMGGLLIVGSANYEDGLTNGGAVRVYDLARAASGEAVLGPTASTGPLALGDIDGDGDLDLFVGGRVIAGRYPEPALSQWLKNEGGRFVSAQKWERLGLVSGAVLSDLDADGDPDLVLACEWGPVRIIRNDGGKFTAITEVSGPGWWHGVTTGDFDGDGRLDIVASNWGRNSRYRAPWQIHYGDLNHAGQVDLVEVPPRGWRMVRAALPFLQEKIASYEAYAQISVKDLCADRLTSLAVNTTDSMVFLNRGKTFEPKPLPAEAQWSPAFGICVADVDGDRAEDIFLSQNFFAMNPETGRHDAGRGLWLKGDSRGGFKAFESGIEVYGEQRGCAVADYDADGRVDLVVAQNRAATKLYRNVGARPGLRVRLRGQSVGAVLRLDQGPAREIHAGSGYLSQDGAVQVLASSGPPKSLWVRWPGGKEMNLTLPAGAREVEASANGELKVIQ